MLFLSLKLANEVFAVETLRVREVMPLTRITRVPLTRPEVRGVVNLRGGIIAVFDLRILLGMEKAPLTAQSNIVVLEYPHEGEILVQAVLVDAVREVLELDQSQLSPPPKVRSNSGKYLQSMARSDHGFILVLNVASLFGIESDMENPAPPADEPMARALKTPDAGDLAAKNIVIGEPEDVVIADDAVIQNEEGHPPEMREATVPDAVDVAEVVEVLETEISPAVEDAAEGDVSPAVEDAAEGDVLPDDEAAQETVVIPETVVAPETDITPDTEVRGEGGAGDTLETRGATGAEVSEVIVLSGDKGVSEVGDDPGRGDGFAGAVVALHVVDSPNTEAIDVKTNKDKTKKTASAASPESSGAGENGSGDQTRFLVSGALAAIAEAMEKDETPKIAGDQQLPGTNDEQAQPIGDPATAVVTPSSESATIEVQLEQAVADTLKQARGAEALPPATGLGIVEEKTVLDVVDALTPDVRLEERLQDRAKPKAQKGDKGKALRKEKPGKKGKGRSQDV
ncbi:MAG: chemotaxis protein CheW [Magnetococcales bacterium]|nr:chemotaxis protein CheW [Magnetococcales bacterium]